MKPVFVVSQNVRPPPEMVPAEDCPATFTATTQNKISDMDRIKTLIIIGLRKYEKKFRVQIGI
jgi:hypothetical protein